jgi:hypothetical protein
LAAALATLLAALSGLLLLLTRLLLPAAALLATLTALLTTLVLAALTALTALAWILISHDLVSPAGKFPQRTTFIPQVRSSRKVIQLMHFIAEAPRRQTKLRLQKIAVSNFIQTRISNRT